MFVAAGDEKPDRVDERRGHIRRAAVSHVVEDHPGRAAGERNDLAGMTKGMVPVRTAVLLVQSGLVRPRHPASPVGERLVGIGPVRRHEPEEDVRLRRKVVGDLTELTDRREVALIRSFQLEEPGEPLPGASADYDLVLVERTDNLVLSLLLVVEIRLGQDGDGEILIEEDPRRHDLVLVLLHRLGELVPALLELTAAGVQKGPGGVAGSAVDVVFSGEGGDRVRPIRSQEYGQPRE